MQPAQQRFWPDSQPLVERLGREFFLTLPKGPGVYLMHGAADVVLYVGKAKSLRHRLSSYRVANPERMARRTLRLLCAVERIAWERCPDEPSAIRRESELLLSLKPRFNRAGTWRGPEQFLAWRPLPSGLELAVMDSPEEAWNHLGPLRGAKHLLQALVRLLWCRFHPDLGIAGMPVGWFRGAHGTRVIIPHHEAALVNESCVLLSSLTNADSESFQQWLLPTSAPYEQSLRDEDLETLARYTRPNPRLIAEFYS